jgi:hypothetical protein
MMLLGNLVTGTFLDRWELGKCVRDSLAVAAGCGNCSGPTTIIYYIYNIYIGYKVTGVITRTCKVTDQVTIRLQGYKT